jgi:hypothetical protein
VLLSPAACGNSRTPAPTLATPVAPGGFRTLTYTAVGISLRAPRSWSVLPARGALVAVITSATAVIALWRYPRAAPPPDRAALAVAARALLRAIRARQAGVKVLSWRLESIDSHPAIELDAIERIHRLVRRVRSTHVFALGEEVVLDEYAPPAIFHAVDHAVFSPVRRSLRLAVR